MTSVFGVDTEEQWLQTPARRARLPCRPGEGGVPSLAADHSCCALHMGFLLPPLWGEATPWQALPPASVTALWACNVLVTRGH